MARKPKLESPLTRELARRLLATLAAERMAATFMEGYAKQFDRPEATAHAERRRELEVILDREILLAMAARLVGTIEEEARRPRKSRKKQLYVIENPVQFQRDLISALSRDAGWTVGDSVEFTGDLDIYRRLTSANAARAASGRVRNVPAGPFVDRCAILLDPSMLENVGRAAGKLLVQVETLADGLFAEVSRSLSEKPSP